MAGQWRAAPWWLRVLAVLGVPWCLALVVIGTTFLFKAGPGLPMIWLGLAGLVPAGIIAFRSTASRPR